jgi:phospholipid/cholesterol/gamma-HCH transport system substrate-binding protein
MKRATIDIWVGLFVALGAAALVFLSVQVASTNTLSGNASYTVTARFEDLGGLKVQAPVKSAGVLVGRVTGIHFDSKTYQAVVTIVLNSDYKFPADTSAKILTAGLLGDQYIGLTPGADIEELADGGEIEITQSALVLEKLIGQFLYSKAAGEDNGRASGGSEAPAPAPEGEAAAPESDAAGEDFR